MSIKSNFHKWLIFAFPYLALLTHKTLMYMLRDIIGIEITPQDDDIILTLLNSTAILFGLKYLAGVSLWTNYNAELDNKNQLKENKNE